MGRVYTNIIPKGKVRLAQSGALEIIANALVCSFGPSGSVTAIRKSKENTRYSKDGHTILQNIKFNRPIEFTMRDDLEDITRRIITTVGDGTTSAILLSHIIFNALLNAGVTYGISDNVLVKELQGAVTKAIEIIDSNKKEVTVDDIYRIAMISTNGNEEVANNLRQIYTDHGMDVFIDVAISNSVDSVLKIYDGLTFDSGYSDPAFINESKKKISSIVNPKIYVFEDPIDTPELRTLMEKIIADNIYMAKDLTEIVPTVIFCPKLSNDMNAMVDSLINQLKERSPEARPPISLVTNIFNGDLLADLAYLSGAKMIKKYIDPKIQALDIEAGLAATLENIHEFAGSAELIESDNSKTKVVNPARMNNEDGTKSQVYKELLIGLNDMLQNYEETKEEITKIGLLKRRINSLQSNMVDYLVGGISMTDRDAVKDLVEDAVLSCRSAAKDGYGFGANFEGLRAFNKLEKDSISDWTIEQIEQLKNGQVFNIYAVLNQAYFELSSLLYTIYCGGNKQNAMMLVAQSITKDSPFNIRTEEFDGSVLSSIKSEQIILDAISKIIGLVFSTNQYLCESPEFNVYIDPE